jgi:hypothetical protein
MVRCLNFRVANCCLHAKTIFVIGHNGLLCDLEMSGHSDSGLEVHVRIVVYL